MRDGASRGFRILRAWRATRYDREVVGAKVASVVVAIIFTATGCGLLLDATPSADGGDSGTIPRDALAPDASDSGPGDVAIGDADAADAGRACPAATIDSTTVALYSFDGDPEGVAQGGVTGLDAMRIAGVVPAAGWCGEGVSFVPSTPHGHVKTPGGSAFALATGSVELWVRRPEADGIYGLLSRDEGGTTDAGHLTLWIASTGHAVIRLQNVDSMGRAWRCSNEPVPHSWTRIGINWGGGAPPELWVDGALATNTETGRHQVNLGPFGTFTARCGAGAVTVGLDDNELPWVMGVNSSDVMDGGDPARLLNPFIDGVIDEVHFRSVRMDFSAP